MTTQAIAIVTMVTTMESITWTTSMKATMKEMMKFMGRL
jgi:hypothetical protein